MNTMHVGKRLDYVLRLPYTAINVNSVPPLSQTAPGIAPGSPAREASGLPLSQMSGR
jgi:hypothetical protein